MVLKIDPVPCMTMGCKRRRCTTTADDLPGDLLDVILARLPLRDAARASVLSVAWGRSWRRLSDLDFTTASAKRDGRKAIDAVLRQHSGPVRRARFKITDAHLPGVQGWTLSLSQQPEGLQALDLAFYTSGPPPPLPEHCMLAPACTRALRDLVLARCVLPPVPAAFLAAGAGFPSLTRLRLVMVSVHEGSDLEAMVSMSPKLEELVMQSITAVLGDDDDAWRWHELRIASQSLRFLEMSGFRNIYCVAACLPRVEHARLLDVKPNSAANILRGMASSVHKLVYCNYYLQIEGLPSSYANLNRLELFVNFSSAREITSMLYFLKSAPNLIQLVVNDLFTDDSNEEPPYQWPPLGSYEICPNLRFLHITALSPLRKALVFMRWVLSSARMLQILEVGTATKTGTNQQIADEIRRYDRVSQGVIIRVIKSYSM